MVEPQSLLTVGREKELAIIEEFLRGVPDGPSALVVEGDVGIGKTNLWQRSVALARALSITVLSCRPTHAESELPYLGLGDLLAFLPDEIVARLPDPQRRALEVALLRADAHGSPMHQRAVSVAVHSVLREASRSAPLLVAIDDAQWLDLPSRRVLQFAGRRLGQAPVGFLVATRTGVNNEDVLGRDGIGAADRVRRLTLGPLALTAVDELVRSRVHARIAGHVLRRVTEASGGNPLFALELLRAASLDPAAPGPGEPLTIPATLTELVGSRLTRLPKATRECLLIAAALSRPTVELIQAAHQGRADVVGALAAAVDAGVIELRGGSVTFVHPLLAGVVHSQASAAELRQVHGRAAGLVQDPEERARHISRSAIAPDEAIAAAIAAGAASAAARGAPDVGAALFEQAARLTPPDAEGRAAMRLVDAADQHIALREMTRARVLLEEVLATSRTGPVRARALHRMARLRAHELGFEAATPTFSEALEHVGDDVALRVAIERDWSFARIQVGDPAGALPRAYAAYKAAVESGRDALLAEALGQLCMAEFVAGNAVPPDLLEQAISVDERVGPAAVTEHSGWGPGRVVLAMTLKWTGRFDLARRLLRSLLTAYTDRGDEGSVDTLIFHLGELELWAGNWQAASELCATAKDMEARTGQAVVERRDQLLLAMLDEAHGNVDGAKSVAKRYLELAEHAADPPGLTRCLKLLGRLELSLGHGAEAAEYLLRGVAAESASGYDHGVCRILPDAIEALIDAGRLPEAQTYLHSLESYAAKPDRSWAVAAAARSRALFDAAEGNLTGAEFGLRRAIDLYQESGEPLERARTLLDLGVVQRRLKKKRESRETLDAALSIFDALGAQRWSEQARAELRRIGGRPATPHELTPTEARIAQLVAEGLTNREVAASVFLSEKTIETNLTRIYEKLAVRSRRELTRKLRAGVPTA